MMTTVTSLDEALDAHDWLRALALALAAWRETRTSELADLIDTIDRQRAREAPEARHHAWWIARAAVYDPAVVPTLITHASAYLDDGPTWSRLSARGRALAATLDGVAGCEALHAGWQLSIIDRFAMIAEWPDDPRVAGLLASWLTEMPCRWAGEVTARFYGGIRDRLVSLGDRRVIDRLAACARRAPGRTGIRELQRRLAAETIAGLVPGSVEVDVGAAPRDVTALWREVALHPDDDGPRLVLADALVERGDPRGEVIALQCAGTAVANRRANRLIKEHWYDWMDVLGLVITRTGSELRRGLLEVVQVGMSTTPHWAYDAVIGHHELATVRTVRAHQLAEADFARFVDQIDHDIERIGVVRKSMVRALRDVRRRWPFRAVELGLTYVDDRMPMSFGDTLDVLAAIAPDLEELALHYHVYQIDDVLAQVARLPLMFAKLRRVTVDPKLVEPIDHAALLAMPCVALDDRRRSP